MSLSLKILLGTIAILSVAACTPGPEDGTQPVGPAPDGKNLGPDGSPLADQGTADGASGAQPLGLANTSVDIKRLRLPDMENLPSDRELTTNKGKPDTNGGVIARPPSE